MLTTNPAYLLSTKASLPTRAHPMRVVMSLVLLGEAALGLGLTRRRFVVGRSQYISSIYIDIDICMYICVNMYIYVYVYIYKFH